MPGALATSSGMSRPTSTKWPTWLVPKWSSKPSSVRPSGANMMPALAMRRSRRSWVAVKRSVNARTLSSDASSSTS